MKAPCTPEQAEKLKRDLDAWLVRHDCPRSASWCEIDCYLPNLRRGERRTGKDRRVPA